MKVLLFATSPSTFVIKDYNILKSTYETTFFNWGKRSPFTLFKLIKSHDISFFWFASIRFIFPLLLSKILKKKIVIITGGYDVANVPELKYGTHYFRWRSNVVKLMCILADKILPVSHSNKDELMKFSKINSEKIEMIYHGFKDIPNMSLNKKENRIITIAFMDNKSFYRKGIDRFLKLAYYMQDIEFHLVGKSYINLDDIGFTKNVIVHGYLENQEFINMLESAKIYIQFSRHEGFGCSVAEAMLYGCIPVVSNSYALPEVVGDTGIIINNFDRYEDIAVKVRQLLISYNSNLSEKCIKRIKNNFNYETRKNKIIKTINDLVFKYYGNN